MFLYVKSGLLEVSSLRSILCLDGLVWNGIHQSGAANADGRLKPYRHSAITSLVWCGSGVERLSWYGNLRIDQVELLAVRELH